MYKFNEKLISELIDGDCNIDKGQSVKLVREVLKYAFPKYDVGDLLHYSKNDSKICQYFKNQYVVCEPNESGYNIPSKLIEDFFDVEIGSLWVKNNETFSIIDDCRGIIKYETTDVNKLPFTISKIKFLKEFKPSPNKQYMVFIEGKNNPKYLHKTFTSAETEAKRLLTLELNNSRLDEVKATIVSVEKVLTATKKIEIV